MKSFLAIAALLVPASAAAEVVGSSANGFELRQTVDLPVAPRAAFAAFAQIPRWWDADHTYSGKAANLSLALRPGGCFCEQLPQGGGVEHMRVAYLAPGERLVMTGSLGPLLYEATSGVMDVQVERRPGGSRLTLNYKVAGFANGGAAKLAPLVDRVLAGQLQRYAKFAAARPRGR
jgi:uncharacterized protein YndB with AHSA1/START domain